MDETQRAVTEVKSWDGAASNYASTDAYCAACLIDVNSAAGNKEKKQSHCMLPVKAPGNNNMIDKALFAASGGRGISAVKRPSDVPEDDWDAAIAKAAKAIVGGYKQLKKEPPEGVMAMTRAVEDKEERSLMFDQVYSKVSQWTYAMPDRPNFSTFFLEGGILFGLFDKMGKLFRASIDVDDDGETLVIGELQPVIHEFTPVTRSSFMVRRQKDGRSRFFMVAATAIINRAGQIDSTLLFDDMIRRADETGFYPKLDWWHCGDVDGLLEYGQFDFLAREGVVYLGSGLLDKDHPLSILTERAVQKYPDKYGASIEYYRPKNRGMEYVPLGNGLEVVAYTEGLNTRISFLPKDYATNWYTGMRMERAMDEIKLRGLRTLFDGDEEEFQAFMSQLTGINREVDKLSLVSRSNTPEPARADAVATAPLVRTPTETPKEDVSIELDDNTLTQLITVLRTQLETGMLKTVTDSLSDITATLAQLTTGQTGVLSQVSNIGARVETLERSDEQKQREWKQDIPVRAGKVNVSYRPSQSAPVVETALTYAEKAAAVLDNKFPKVGVQ